MRGVASVLAAATAAAVAAASSLLLLLLESSLSSEILDSCAREVSGSSPIDCKKSETPGDGNCCPAASAATANSAAASEGNNSLRLLLPVPPPLLLPLPSPAPALGTPLLPVVTSTGVWKALDRCALALSVLERMVLPEPLTIVAAATAAAAVAVAPDDGVLGNRSNVAAGLLWLLLLTPTDLLLLLFGCKLPLPGASAAAAAGEVRAGRHSRMGDLPAHTRGGMAASLTAASACRPSASCCCTLAALLVQAWTLRSSSDPCCCSRCKTEDAP